MCPQINQPRQREQLMKSRFRRIVVLTVYLLGMGAHAVAQAEDWSQFKFDSRHSGYASDRSIRLPLGLMGTVPLTDAIFTSPVIANGRVFVIDGSGVVFCIDAATLQVLWKFESRGGRFNCNNVSSPAVVDRYLHFGTMAGTYYVLDVSDGTVVRQISCGEPIFSSPVAASGRVYCATLGSRVYALESDGEICWVWDFVEERFGFQGDRWNGQDWLRHKQGRVTRDDLFCCHRDIAVYGRTLLLSTDGTVVWLQDMGASPQVRAVSTPHNTTLGLSVSENGTAYRQWTLLDNGGQVDILKLRDDGKVQAGSVGGTRTSTRGGLLSFSSVSLRNGDVYRCRPEEGFGLCRHRARMPVPAPIDCRTGSTA